MELTKLGLTAPTRRHALRPNVLLPALLLRAPFLALRLLARPADAVVERGPQPVHLDGPLGAPLLLLVVLARARLVVAQLVLERLDLLHQVLARAQDDRTLRQPRERRRQASGAGRTQRPHVNARLSLSGRAVCFVDSHNLFTCIVASMEPTWQEPTRHTTCTQEHGGWHALGDYTPRGGKGIRGYTRGWGATRTAAAAEGTRDSMSQQSGRGGAHAPARAAAACAAAAARRRPRASKKAPS